ncbi:ribosome recycling factor [Vulgatibacter incomptus]|uniref:Ribosome-recycling factor n=1 Tax=Vulgatibacter incomptus TaxID=1391653 RepID=A0A0K1PAZ2_9BACT|nr:ribosome recycling factor [Vulgatibacter incomptus]AKU90279.1 Ribosome recycling factor [Vulgatibacter incomptus]
MAGEEIIKDFKGRVEKTLEDLRRELSKIRTGRANASVLEGVQVDSYGSRMPLNAVATITVPDARTIVIKPFDRSQIPAIEKGINEAGVGITPQNDGTVIRLPVPPLTEERRKEIAKQVKKRGEEHKVAVRNLRRDANEQIKAQTKDSVLSTDDEKRLLDQVQKETDGGIAMVDQIVARKEKEVMEI